MKILFFTDPKWTFGSIDHEVCKYLMPYNIQADLLDWNVTYALSEIQLLLSQYDYIVSMHDGIHQLVNVYQVPINKVIIQGHNLDDILLIREKFGSEIFQNVAGYSVVSNTVFQTSLTLGIGCLPHITPLGINTKKYTCRISSNCRVAGYSSAGTVRNLYGNDIKRGELAEQCALQAGLDFRPIKNTCYQAMPAYYQGIDVLLCSSIQEGSGLSALEASASGKLVISTPVGHWPQCMQKNMGIQAPYVAEEYVEFVSDKLKFLSSNPDSYKKLCWQAHQAAQQWDWSFQIPHWVKFFRSL